ncbi:MAG TPA: hypothetical protein VIV11_18440, partial [Kofleriaceae bacterium]
MRIIFVGCVVLATTAAHAERASDTKLVVAIAECERGEPARCMQAAAEMKQLRIGRHREYTQHALRDRGFMLFEQQCDDGVAAACLEYGRKLLRDDDTERGFEEIERACKLGSADACLLLGNRRSTGDRALVLFDRACTNGSARACERLAEQLELGKQSRSASYRRRIAELHRKACDGDDAVGCMRSGEVRLAAGDRVGALVDLGKSCDLGEARSCDRAGLLAPPEGARVLFMRACDADIASGCKHLSQMYARGRGGQRNWSKAIAFAETACNVDRVAPCTAANQLRQHPPDWRCHDEQTCAQLCDEGIGRSCRRLAELHHGALADYERGCAADDRASCTLRGHGAETFDDAATWYKLGCRAGDRSACQYVQFAKALDGSVAARDALRKQCSADPTACVLVGLAVVDRQPREAEQRWRAACARDQGVGCRLVADQLARNRRRSRSTRLEAEKLMELACKRGDPVACKQQSAFAPA